MGDPLVRTIGVGWPSIGLAQTIRSPFTDVAGRLTGAAWDGITKSGSDTEWAVTPAAIILGGLALIVVGRLAASSIRSDATEI